MINWRIQKKPGWVWAFTLFLLLIVVQGALRKWVFPGLAGPLYIAKDVALLTAFTLYVLRHGLRVPSTLKKGLFPVLWLGLAVITFLQMFNINLPGPANAIIGFKSYMFYTVLLMLVPFYLDQIAVPYLFIRKAVIVVFVPVLILGIYQYFQPVGSWINQYSSDTIENIASVLGRPRITGTFSYIGGMSFFLVFSLFLGTGMAVAGVRFGHRNYYRLGLFLLILSLVVAPMNGSRSVIFGFFLPLPIILYLLAKQSAKKVIAVFVLGMVIFGVFTTVQLDIFQSGWDTFTHRATTASDRDSRIESMLMDPIYKLEVGGGTGYGTGATHQAVSGFSSGQRISIPDVGYEGERGRVIIELGIVGFLFFLLLKIYITFIAWKAMNKADKPVEYLLSITAFCFLFSSLVVGSIVFNHIEGALYWLCAGFVIWVWNKKL